jgi:non-ribosomal peptide synthetase component F
MLALDLTGPKREGGDSAAKAWLRALAATAPIGAHPTRTIPVLIEELAETYGDAPALLSDRETLTYRELAARANRYARWGLELGVEKGDTVCLMMPNRPEYLAIWLGVTRIGGVVALLNTSLAAPHSPIASRSSIPSTSSWRRSSSAPSKARSLASPIRAIRPASGYMAISCMAPRRTASTRRHFRASTAPSCASRTHGCRARSCVRSASRTGRS